jgi:hypothetical protein
VTGLPDQAWTVARPVIRADVAIARADCAEQGREGERSRADALRDRLEVLQAKLAAAERASDDVQAARTGAEERKGRAGTMCLS